MSTITPECLIHMIFRSCKLGEFSVNFVEACKEFAKIYFGYPDALKAAKKSFESNVPTVLLQYVIDNAKTEELGADLQLCLDGLMQIADVIPALSYSFKTLNIKINNQDISNFMNQDYDYCYQTEDGVTTRKDQVALCAKCETAQEVCEVLTKHFDRPMDYQYQEYSKIAQQIISLRQKYLEQNQIVQSAKEKALPQIPERPKMYCSLYTSFINSISFCQFGSIKSLFAKSIKDPKKRDTLVTAAKEFGENVDLNSQVVKMLLMSTKAQAMSTKGVTFTRYIEAQKQCDMVSIAVRYFQCVLDLVRFTRREYEALYDETRLASEFEVNGIQALHEDMIQMLGSSLAKLPYTSHRVDGSKLLITNFVGIFAELEKEKFKQHCPEQYSLFYTQKFKRSETRKAARRGKKAAEPALVFQNELNFVIHALDVLLQNVPASKMIDIAGDLMCCQTFAPLGVHIVTHL